MADQKNRGGQKQGGADEGRREQNQDNVVTNKPGDRPEAQKVLRGRDSMNDPIKDEG
jgi:hypothetical protein